MRDGSRQWPPTTGGGLPPSAPLPSWLQTLALRRWPVSYLESCRSRLGPRFTVFPLDMQPLVFLTDPNDIAAVLVAPASTLRPGMGAEVIAPLIGETSFILSDDEDRKTVRSAVSPAFRQREGPRNARLATAIAREEIALWPINRPVALYPHLSALTLRVILRVLFGEDTEIRSLGPQLLAMLSIARSFVIQEPRLRYLPGWNLSWKRFQHRRSDIDRQLRKIIARRRREHSECSHVLEMLMSARRDGVPITDREVSDNLLSLIVAGHETTASTLAWAFLFLAHNPEVQGRLVKEIDAGESEQYLAATVLETLRRGPVFLFAIPRAVVAPTDICGITYRPSVQLIPCTYLMHNDPALYTEPQAFRPERFIDKTPPSLIWKPWGGGRRRCLGQHLAELEMRTVLREALTILQVLAAGPRIEGAKWRSAIVAPRSGARVVLRARTVRGAPALSRSRAAAA